MAATARAFDYSNVKDPGNFNPVRIEPGDYRAKITKVDDHTPKSGSAPNQWVFTIEVDGKRGSYPYYVGWDEKQAWKSRNLCLAAGMAVPKKRVKVDPNKLIGKTIGIAVDDDEYEGKIKSSIVGVFPADEVVTSKASTKAKSSAKVEDDDEDTTDDDEDVDDLDLEEI